VPDVQTGLGYTSGSGTSFATPLVAGVVALIKSVRPTWSPYQIYYALTSTASKSSSPDNLYGYGVVDTMKAINSTVHNEFGCHQNCNGNGACYQDICHCYDDYYGLGCENKKRSNLFYN
jgi:subtilase family serine protease